MGRGLLFLVGGMFIVVGIVQNGMNNRSSILPVRAIDYQEELHATNAVNSAMDYALREIVNDQSWNEGLQADSLLGASVSIQIYDEDTPDKPVNNVPVWDEYSLLIYGVAEFEGQVARSELFLKKDSFSKYSYFTDSEISMGQDIYFIWLDEISGPVHTNGTFNIAGDPTFHGDVTSPNDWQGYGGMENDPQFLGESNFEADEIEPPTSFSLDILKNTASSNGLTFDREVRLEFLSDGNVDVRMKYGNYWSPSQTVDLSNYNGVISSSENISMHGTINGQYTIHSEKNIEITGDIRYNQDPRDHPESTDLLGIVSEKEVVIDDDAHRHEGYNDLTIHASIMALNKSFKAENYNHGGKRGDLNLLGGVIQDERGPVGTFSGNSVQNGFNKSYEYDERLLEVNPPSFPRESFFSIVHWLTNTAPEQAEESENENENES